MTDYVRVSKTRLQALENTERQLHELRARIAQQEAAKQNALFLADQLLPPDESVIEIVASASRNGELTKRRTPPPQTLDETLPDVERDSPDDLLAAIEAMPPDQARTTLTKVAPLSFDAALDAQREKHRTHAERSSHATVMRPMEYGEIFATIMEMMQNSNDVVITTKLLTPQNVQTVMEGIETGMSRKGACGLVGITNSTLQRYKRMADEDPPQEPFASFIQLLEMAEARAEAVLIGRWQRHTTESWQAAKSLLEKRFRAEWGEKPQIDLDLGELLKKSPEELLAIMGNEARQQVIEIEREVPE